MAPPVAGAASAPSTRPSGAGPGPPTQIAAAKGGGCIRLGRGHSNLKLKSLFLLPQCNLQKWGLKVKERLRRQQLLTQEGDPAGHGRALLLEHTPGRQLVRGLRWLWALVLVLTHPAPLPHNLSEPFQLKVFPPCIEGESVQMEGEKITSQSRLTDLKRSQEFEDRGLVLFSIKILHMSYLYIKQNPHMCNPN